MSNKDNKRSIYFGDPVQTLLARVGSDNMSGAINTAVSRYLAIMEDHRPKFTRNEWCAICAMLNGTIIDDTWQRRGGRLLALEMEDSAADGLWQTWEIDGPGLVAKLAALTTAESLAVLHVVEVFWEHSDLDHDAALAKAGLKF